MTEDNQTENQTEENQSKPEMTVGGGSLGVTTKLTLAFGYQDKEDSALLHQEVVFSKRPTGADFIRAIEETEGAEPDFTLAIMAAAISKFGALRMPTPMTVLLSLNWRDRELLTAKFFEFLGATAGDTEAKTLTTDTVQIAFGIARDGVKYHVLKFGAMLTAYDEINIRKETNSLIERQILTIGREIVSLATADGARQIGGGVTLEELKTLDWESFVAIQNAEENWRNSFRR